MLGFFLQNDHFENRIQKVDNEKGNDKTDTVVVVTEKEIEC